MNPSTPLSSDAVIVGGGPAGITAALYLARFNRTVTVIDAGQSRLATVPRSHNYPGFAEGISGARLLQAMRAQLQRYPVHWRQGTVETICRHGRGFELHCADGTALRSPLVLLATGVADIAPPLPHVLQALQQGLLRYCPVCDGHEVSGRRVGVYANGAAGVAEALYLRHFTPHITVFVEGGGGTLAPADRARLQEAGIALVQAPVRSIHQGEACVTVVHGDGQTASDSLYCALGLRIRSALAIQLGAACTDDGYVRVDRHGATTADGVFAIGDLAEGLNQIAVATGEAAIAATAVHARLLRGA